MRGGPLDVEQPPRHTVGAEESDELDESDLGRVGPPVEHRLAGEQASEADAVQATGQLSVRPVPDLDAVRDAEGGQPRIRGPDVLADPAARPPPVGAARDHRLEVAVEGHGVAPRRPPQRPGDAQPVEWKYAARVG